MHHHPPPQTARAVLAVSVATGLFAAIFASEKLAREVWPGIGLLTVQIMALRYFGGLATVIAAIGLAGVAPARLRSRQVGIHALRAACGMAAGGMIIAASAAMPLVDATALSLMSAVFMIVIGVVFFGDRIGWRRALAIGLCVAGAVAIVFSRGAFRSFSPSYLWPAALALASALFAAIEGALIKRLAGSESTLGVLLYVNAFGALFSGLAAALVWQPIPPALVLAFLALGPVAILAQALNIYGYRRAELSLIAPLDYLWLVFAALFGLLLFDEVLSRPVALGALLVLSGGALLAAERRRAAR